MASDFFSDKKFENLDWISQAVEPWEWDVLDACRQLPEIIEITPANIVEHYEDYYGFSWDSIPKAKLKELLGDRDDYEGRDVIKSLYKVEMEPDTVLDLTSNTLTNPIRLIKQKPTLTDDEVKAAAWEVLSSQIGGIWDLRDSDRYARAGEILDLIGANLANGRGHRNRRALLSVELKKVFNEDKWHIRNMDLVSKVGLWISNYIRSGDVSAMANFAKLKVMTHAGKPLYSIVEVE